MHRISRINPKINKFGSMAQYIANMQPYCSKSEIKSAKSIKIVSLEPRMIITCEMGSDSLQVL